MSARDDAERIVGRFKGYVVSGSSSEYEAVRVRLVRLVAAAIDLAENNPDGDPAPRAIAWTVDADYLRELAAAVRALIDEMADMDGECVCGEGRHGWLCRLCRYRAVRDERG